MVQQQPGGGSEEQQGAAAAMEGHQGPGRMVQPGGEQLPADPRRQIGEGHAVVLVKGDQFGPEGVAPAQLAQGLDQGGVFTEAADQPFTPGAGIDHLAPHRQGAPPWDPEQGHQHQGAPIPAGPHPPRQAACLGLVPAVARHRADPGLAAGPGQIRQPIGRDDRIGINQGDQGRGGMQVGKGLA